MSMRSMEPPRDTWTPSTNKGPITYEKAGAKVISEESPRVLWVMVLKLSVLLEPLPLPSPSLKENWYQIPGEKGILETLLKCIAALFLCVT